MLRIKFSPLILRMFTFSSSRIIAHKEQTKPKLFYKAKSLPLVQNCRFTGTSPTVIRELNYEQLKKIIDLNEALIIDVRTKQELAATGVLPNSFNIPLNELRKAFELTPDEFLEKYNVCKPDKDRFIIFSCAKGIRSLQACHHLKDLGYKNLFNYTEGWYGWESHK